VRWFDRYLDVVAEPLLRLYLDVGLALEAHHQNTLVTLDADGMPGGGWYRDSQGYWIAESAAEQVLAGLAGTAVDRSSLVFDDALVAERFTYYFLVNNLLGLVGALGSERLADEQVLLGRLRERVGRLASQRAAHGRRTSRDALLEHWLTGPSLRCKANLLTTVDGRDELIGHPASQSVYVDIPNPLLESAA
jgi:siderophore synthetase component